MDEPFAALDEQTRMYLGEELSALLATTNKTIILVTHSLSEAVFLADRVVVMTARPAAIKATIEVPAAHPREARFMASPRIRRLPQRALRAPAQRDREDRRRLRRPGRRARPRSAVSWRDERERAAMNRSVDWHARAVQIGFVAVVLGFGTTSAPPAR